MYGTGQQDPVLPPSPPRCGGHRLREGIRLGEVGGVQSLDDDPLAGLRRHHPVPRSSGAHGNTDVRRQLNGQARAQEGLNWELKFRLKTKGTEGLLRSKPETVRPTLDQPIQPKATQDQSSLLQITKSDLRARGHE